jgi:hypothetical protein
MIWQFNNRARRARTRGTGRDDARFNGRSIDPGFAPDRCFPFCTFGLPGGLISALANAQALGMASGSAL